jgi:hypothetical protein
MSDDSSHESSWEQWRDAALGAREPDVAVEQEEPAAEAFDPDVEVVEDVELDPEADELEPDEIEPDIEEAELIAPSADPSRPKPATEVATVGAGTDAVLERFDSIELSLEGLRAYVRAALDAVTTRLENSDQTAGVADVQAGVRDLRNDVIDGFDAVRTEIESMRFGMGRPSRSASTSTLDLEPLAAELEAMRTELTQLKRRIAVRAKPVSFSDEDLDRISRSVADLVAERFQIVVEDATG